MLDILERNWGLEIVGFGRPFHITKKNKSEIFVCDMDHDAIIEVDLGNQKWRFNNGVNGWSPKKKIKESTFVTPETLSRKKLWGPHSSSIDEHGNVFVICYYGRTLWKLDASGYASKTLADDVLFGPASMSRMDRNIWAIADYGSNSILWCDDKFKPMGRLGYVDGKFSYVHKLNVQFDASGSKGALDRVHMISAYEDGRFLVADSWNNRLLLSNVSLADSIYNSSLSNADQQSSLVEYEGFDVPVSVDINPQGEVLVASWNDSQITFLDNKFRRFSLDCPVDLKRPYHAIFDNESVFVVDSHNSRVLFVERPNFI